MYVINKRCEIGKIKLKKEIQRQRQRQIFTGNTDQID